MRVDLATFTAVRRASTEAHYEERGLLSVFKNITCQGAGDPGGKSGGVVVPHYTSIYYNTRSRVQKTLVGAWSLSL